MTRHSPQQQFKQAQQIARDHGCFVVEKGGEFSLYRRMAMRNVFIGKRRTPEALHALVCRATNFH
jgi:hypothetical protein